MERKVAKQGPSRQEGIDGLLAALPEMERGALLKLWHDYFDRTPSPALRRETLIPILACRIQEEAFRGLRDSTARKLRGLVEESAAGRESALIRLRPKIGTRYVREHHGKMHEVTVLESGYEYEDRAYRSLTEISRVITGTKWSGPVFFGHKREIRRTTA